MEGEASRGSIMMRICWRSVDILSRMLSFDEREAVRGDLAESGATGSQALLDVLSLVMRRQAALWAHWRPWLTLVGLVVPLGMLVSVVSRRAAGLSAIYIWMYANNWDWNLLGYRGFWYQFAQSFEEIFLVYLTLVCWSWTSGFVLGSASRGIIRLNSFLLCVMLSFGGLLGAPLYLAFLDQYLHRTLGLPSLPDYNAPVFELTFYRLIFPLIVQAVLVVVPALWGLRQGAGVARVRPLFRAILCVVAVATLAAMLIQIPELGFFLKTYRRPWIRQWEARLQFVVYWPVGYLVATSIGRRWRLGIGSI
jgi:hypothetical protein